MRPLLRFEVLSSEDCRSDFHFDKLSVSLADQNIVSLSQKVNDGLSEFITGHAQSLRGNNAVKWKFGHVRRSAPMSMIMDRAHPAREDLHNRGSHWLLNQMTSRTPAPALLPGSLFAQSK